MSTSCTPFREITTLLGLAAALGCSSSHSATRSVDAGPVVIDASTATTPMVMTTLGPVAGVANNDPLGDGVYRSFYGIPYAKPPVADLRWRAPVPPDPWTDPPTPQPRDAFLPPMCPQILPLGSSPLPAGDEDCLYLNVDTPVNADASAMLPVVVWIHGGGFSVGEGRQSDNNTRGDLVAQRQNVVLVSFNYRLGQLGFLAHPGLTAEQGGASGNYGLLDQIAALRWVKANIAAFGGDPENITIMGQSAGGISVCGLLTTPLIGSDEDLFQRAILESAPCDRPAQSLALAEAQGTSFAAALGCTNADPAMELECLRQKTMDEVRSALPPPGDIVRPQAGEALWGPILDGHYFPSTDDATGHPLAIIATGNYRKVPILIGYMKNEGTAIMNLSMQLPAPLTLRMSDDTTYRAQVAALVVDGPSTAAFLDLVVDPTAGQYRSSLPAYAPVASPAGASIGTDSSQELAFADLLGDLGLGCPTRRTLLALADASHGTGQPIYSYYFSYGVYDAADSFYSPPFQLPAALPLYAFHSGDVQFFFGRGEALFKPTFTPEEQELSDRMQDYFGRFIRTGDPNGGDDPAWPMYTSDGRAQLELGVNGLDPVFTPTSDARAGECAVFDQNGGRALIR